MPYNDKPMIRVNGQIVPQVWDNALQDWVLLQGVGGAYRVQNAIDVTDDYFEGSGNLTKEFASEMIGLIISNDSEPGTIGAASLTFTINGVTRTVKAGEVYENKFKPFTSVTVNSTVPWRAEPLQSFYGASLDVPTPADTTAPDNVTDLATSNVTATSLTLTWTASASNDCVGYDVYRGTSLLATVTGTTYNVTGLSQNTQYTFTVKAKDASNNIASGSSTTITTAASADTTPPANVTGLSYSNLTQSSMTLNWAASSSSDVASYDIFNGTTFIANVTSTTYNVNGLAAGTVYTFVVKAKDASGNSASGASVNVTTAVSIPSTPTGLSATPGNAQVALSWASVSGAASYKVYRGGTLISSPTTTSYTDTTAANGTTYSYTVSAINASGESAQSTTVSATPSIPVTVPTTPTGLTATSGNAQVSLSWTAVSGATSYNVYRGGTKIASPTTPNYSDTGLTNGTAYSYTVSAVNSTGESTQSTAQSATPAAPSDTTPPVLTITPAAGTYTAVQSVSMSANETSTIYYTTDGTEPTTSSTVYSSAISISTTTTIKAFARDAAGNSSAVQTVLYTINLSDTTPPSPVTNLVAGTPTTSTVPITFTASSSGDVANVEVAYSIDGTNFTVSSSSVAANATSFTVTGLTAATAYTIRVVAIDTSNNRSTAVTVQASTTAAAGQPTDVNLFDKTKVTAGFSINTTTGAETANAGWNASEYIPLEEGKIYRFGMTAGNKVFYDVSKTFLSSITLVNTLEMIGTLSRKFFRTSVQDTNLNTYSVVKTTKVNLHDYTQFTNGQTLSTTDGSQIAGSATVNLSPFIPVTGGATYLHPNNNWISSRCEYDSNHTFIRAVANNLADLEHTVSANAAYVRYIVSNTNLREAYYYLKS